MHDEVKYSRQEALKVGSSVYFSKKPCKKGHLAARRIGNGDCTECVILRNRHHYSLPEYSARRAIRNKKNPEPNRERVRAWQKENPDRTALYRLARRSAELVARPKWLTEEDNQSIKEIYKKARQLSSQTNKLFTVDHICPIRGKTVCGLHVPWNLQVITAKENIMKSNKLLNELSYSDKE